MADFQDEDQFKSRFNTELTPEQEAAYQQWADKNNRTQDDVDYDMRGAWLEQAGQSDNGHYPDTYKKPNHPTFSDQSKYSGTDDPNGGKFVGGTWGKTRDGQDTFTPSKEMLQKTHSITWLRDYMQRVEPDAKLILPK